MAKTQLNPLGLGYAGAVLAAISMLVMGIFGNIGIYTAAVEQMMKWHAFFSLSIGGILAGMVEAALWTFVSLYIFGLLYNKFG